MKWDIVFTGMVQKFPGSGGWVYVPVPNKYTQRLKKKRRVWGMFPITAHVGDTTWDTKLMTKKGGDYFVALKASIRNKEKITVGSKISISFKVV